MTNKQTSKKIPLEFPFEHDGRTIDSLTLRRMRAGDTLVAEGTESGALAGFHLLAALSGQDIELIKLLDVEDLMTAMEAMVTMTGKHGVKILEEAKSKANKA